ncbi:ADP-ribosylglycohydrolase family protein [Ramlibacter alkalitolerans]|uniref:ADP-ribosylglycohydrolase family protein n=1 Tax=Ramlibacter alkalitolerans TaxID=2039631 RepID=A0ABS1JTX2_9BURK|nr:ADP-ribosylglycohydrolase family protein [Ramlibacter alkalitolerans]MBL0427698.1 ADP-ribosylglycohydrolase family protein [Ramlibacter alkalitolerans]
MLGAIIGDILGSPYEDRYPGELPEGLFQPACRVTDDSTLTVATMDALLHGLDPAETYRRYALRFTGEIPDTSIEGRKTGRMHHAGYGPSFEEWARTPGKPANISNGNGCVMRIAPLAYMPLDEPALLAEAERFTRSTHNDDTAVLATQVYVFALRRLLDAPVPANGRGPKVEWPALRQAVLARFPAAGQMLGDHLDEYPSRAQWMDPSLQANWLAHEAVRAVMVVLKGEVASYEKAVSRAILIGGDTDTVGCITGGLAEAQFGIPKRVLQRGREFIPPELLEIVDKFYAAYGRPRDVPCTEAAEPPAVTPAATTPAHGALPRPWWKRLLGVRV